LPVRNRPEIEYLYIFTYLNLHAVVLSSITGNTSLRQGHTATASAETPTAMYFVANNQATKITALYAGLQYGQTTGSFEKGPQMDNERQPTTKAQEMRAFLFLTVVLAPLLSVAIVGGYGFFVWMYQLVTGTLPSG
jgi:periplasmic nitrate reductase NapE